MTALELTRAGVEWVRPEGALVSVRGRSSLVEAVQRAVAARAPRMLAPPQLPVRHGACDACGEAMEPHRGGWCELCELARRVALRQRGGPR